MEEWCSGLLLSPNLLSWCLTPSVGCAEGAVPVGKVSVWLQHTLSLEEFEVNSRMDVFCFLPPLYFFKISSWEHPAQPWLCVAGTASLLVGLMSYLYPLSFASSHARQEATLCEVTQDRLCLRTVSSSVPHLFLAHAHFIP